MLLRHSKRCRFSFREVVEAEITGTSHRSATSGNYQTEQELTDELKIQIQQIPGTAVADKLVIFKEYVIKNLKPKTRKYHNY